jgi:predicted amidophosphoribosyltransferase
MSQRKFTWPPSQGSSDHAQVSSSHGEAASGLPTDPQMKADDQPLPSQHNITSSGSATTAPHPHSFIDVSQWSGIAPPRFPALHAAITLFEQTWLGVVRPTLYDRAQEAGWRPDPPASYCPVCGVSVGAYEALDPLDAADIRDAGCMHCRGEKVIWDRFVRLGTYDGLLREVVLEVKFSHWRHLGVQAGGLLGAALTYELARCGLERAVIIPVPIHPLRRIMRGIDHTYTLARGMRGVRAAGFELTIAPLLARRWRRAQAKLSSAQRKLNVKNSMYVRHRKYNITQPKTALVVVDDVRTTGATLTEACRCLRGALGTTLNIPIWAAVLACAEPRSQRRTTPTDRPELSDFPE